MEAVGEPRGGRSGEARHVGQPSAPSGAASPKRADKSGCNGGRRARCKAGPAPDQRVEENASGHTRGLPSGPSRCPADPKKLEISHPSIWKQAYGDEGSEPVQPRVPKLRLLRLQAKMPCRSTKAMCLGMGSVKGGGRQDLASALADALVQRFAAPIVSSAQVCPTASNAVLQLLPREAGPPVSHTTGQASEA